MNPETVLAHQTKLGTMTAGDRFKFGISKKRFTWWTVVDGGTQIMTDTGKVKKPFEMYRDAWVYPSVRNLECIIE